MARNSDACSNNKINKQRERLDVIELDRRERNKARHAKSVWKSKARKVSEVIRKDSIPYAKAKSQANSIKEALLPKLGVGVTDLGIGL